MDREKDNALRRKKPFRARGSRGGTRKRRENKSYHTQNPAHNAPTSHHRHHNHHHASYHQYQQNHYQNQGQANYHMNYQQHQQPQQHNAYANMAQYSNIEHTKSSGNSSILSRDENYNPYYSSENTGGYSETYNTNQQIIPTAGNKPGSTPLFILPSDSKEHSNAIDNMPLLDAEILNSLTSATSFSTSTSTYANINESESANDFEIEGELDLVHAIHPLSENTNHLAKVSPCAEQSYFVTSPRSFLMGSKIFSS
jgi:hypothetical protein